MSMNSVGAKSRAVAIITGAIAFMLMALLISPTRAQAAPQTGEWDGRFGWPGVDGKITALAIAANGDIYVGGDFSRAGGTAAKNIARWDGDQWHALGDGLSSTTWPREIVIDDESNRVYVIGGFNQAGVVAVKQIAQWDGANWSAVGTGEGPYNDTMEGWLNTGVIYKGQLIVGGDFDHIDGVAANNIAAWNGSTWLPLDQGIGKPDWEDKFSAEGSVTTLNVDEAKDVLYAGGDFALAGQVQANSIAAWNGTAWSALGGGITQKEGGSDPQPGLVAAVYAFNGKVYAGGLFNRADGAAANNIAYWNGSAWAALGQGVTAPQFTSQPTVNALTMDNGLLYVGGDFVGAGGQSIPIVAAWNGSEWSAIGAGVPTGNYETVYKLDIADNGDLIMGGYFHEAGHKRVDGMARWTGTEWMAFGAGLTLYEYGDRPGNPYAIVADGTGRLFVGGEFVTAGGERVNHIAMWQNGRWHNMGGADGRVRALALVGDDLYVGGEFTKVGSDGTGVGASHIARYQISTGTWSALGAGIDGDVRALAFADGILYAGGAFKAAGAVSAEDVAWWDGAQWHAFGNTSRIFEVGNQGGEVGTYVNALVVRGDSVYIAGHFQTVQRGTNTADLSSFTVVHNVVEWNRVNDQWLYLGDLAKRGVTTDGFSGLFTDAASLALVDDVLYIGGAFNQAGAGSALGLGAWDIQGDRWLPLNANIGGHESAQVTGLAGYGMKVFVAGQFTSVGNTTSRFVAEYDSATNTWATLGIGLKWYNDRFTRATAITASKEGVYVGGDFDNAGNLSASGFAYWREALDGGTLPPPEGQLKVKTYLPALTR